MIDWGAIRSSTPPSCERCGGSDFADLGTGHPNGPRGLGIGRYVRCRRCGAAWTALALLDAVAAGVPLEWFCPDAEPGAAADTGGRAG